MTFAFFVSTPVRKSDHFLNLGSLADTAAEVVELSASNLTLADNVNINYVGGVEREGLLNAATIGNTSNGKGLRDSAAMLCNNGTLEHLNSFACAFLNLVVNTNGVTNIETGNGFLLLLSSKSLNQIHL